MGRGIASKVTDERIALGLRSIWRPRKIVPGPFVFIGSITDNAVTPIDLTADASNVDQALERFIGGGADAGGILQIEAVAFYLDKGAETDALYEDILESVYLRHLGRDYEERVSLAPYAQTVAQGVAVSDSTASTLQYRSAQALRQIVPLAYPWLVNLRTDTFEIAMRAAVNTAADVPIRLDVYGAAWQETDGYPDSLDCPDRKQAIQLRQFNRGGLGFMQR